MAFNYVGKYQNYLRNTNSNDDPIILANKQFALQEFDHSYFTNQVLVDDIEYTVMVKQEKKDEDKKLIFKPDVKVDKGSVVKIGDLYYLVNNFLGDGVYEIYPTATLKQCNSFFPAITDKTRVLKGYDDYGKPVYVEEPVIKQLPCIVEHVGYSLDTNQQLVTSNDSLKISLQYFVSESIKKNAEFYMYDEKYKITSIDKTKVINNVGILTITGERV